MDRDLKIGIIGAGKVGVALGYVLQKKGFDVVAISDKEERALESARKYLLEEKVLFTKINTEVVKNADMVIIAVHDRVIREVAEEICTETISLTDKVFAHTCGSMSSDALKPLYNKGAHTGVFHPLQTFPDIESAINVIPDTFFFIEAKDKAKEVLSEIGESIGKGTKIIEAHQMVLYHLSAVFVCNLLCALMHVAEGIMKKLNLDLEPFFPIIRATLKNIEEKGPLFSLTGPIIRGDIDTVQSHLKAIEGEEVIKVIYKDLSLVATDMARLRGAIDEETYKRLQKILREG